MTADCPGTYFMARLRGGDVAAVGSILVPENKDVASEAEADTGADGAEARPPRPTTLDDATRGLSRRGRWDASPVPARARHRPTERSIHRGRRGEP
jgi:hypothetical protein